MIEKGKEEECAIIAENQTAGIGRGKRTWESFPGNLFASIITKLTPDYDCGKLSLTVACAVHDAVSGYVSNDLYLHWSNDIYYKKTKLAGILITVISYTAVVSVGINVNSAPETNAAISLRDICCSDVVSVEKVFNDVLIKLEEWFSFFEKFGFFCIRNYWLRHINEIDCKVTVKNGSDCLSGTVRGIDDSGRLILEKDGKKLLISSGDMFLNTERITISNE
jgi:BirA family biotin operon repressor/biotin-[acetyl-CoA-carboxylase] ligase